MPKLTIHLDGSGDWGHAYVSITSSSGVEDFAGLWPKNPNDYSVVFPGEGTIRGNDPIPNPYYNPALPKTGPDPADPDFGRDPNSRENYPSDKQRYETVHYSDLPRHKNTPRYDKSYDINEAQYQNVKNHINNAKSDPQYTVAWENCTDFVQSVWKATGFDGSFADNIASEILAKMGFAGIWSWFWQKDIDVTGDLSGVWANAKLGNFDPAPNIEKATRDATTLTPISLDLSGNGRIDLLSSTTASNKVFFDIDNDNFKEKVSWITGGDGWLARDSNNNGVIDNQRELFGDSDGKLAYQKLAELNTNNSGASANSITSADTAWSALRVWIDANNNGVSDAGELKTLSELGITSISLESSNGSKKGTFAQNGVSKLTQDINLDVKQENSWYVGTASEIKPETLLLPLSRGYGDVKSMHFAASENTTLLTQLKEIATLPIASLDSYYAKLQTMVYNWAGASGVATSAYGALVDAQHVATIEKFAGYGLGLYQDRISGTLSLLYGDFQASLARERGYESLISEFAVRFATQGALKAVFGNPTYDFSTDKLVFTDTLAEIITNAKANVPSDSVDKNVYWSEIARTLKLYARDLGSTEANVKTQLDTAAGYNITINNIGGRYFEGDAGNNVLNGNALSNSLVGGNGLDTLIGGKGDDYLEGGTGADLYRYASGDGNDYIYELTSGSGTGAIDVLQFTDLNRSSLTFSRTDSNDIVQSNGISNDSLKITVAGGGSVLIRDHFKFDTDSATNASWRVEQIKFADGTTMDFASSKAATFRATSGNDVISGFSDAETINGLAGNDKIKGFGGNDSISGGVGNDTINGDDGNDLINGGAGKDLLLGDLGNDIFVFDNVADNQAVNADFIRGFLSGTDKIDVRGAGFKSLDTDGGATEAGELRFSTNGGMVIPPFLEGVWSRKC